MTHMFRITDKKLRTFVEEAQDFLDAGPGNHLTLHRVADDRSEKQIARYDNDRDWADSWLEEVVSDLLKTASHARLRLRRWRKGGVGQGSFAFEVGETAAPEPQPAAPAPTSPMPPVQVPPAEEPPPTTNPDDVRLSGLEARLSQLSAAISTQRPQPPDYQLAMTTERALMTAQQAQRMAEETRERAERAERSLRSTQAELDALKAADTALRERQDVLEEKLLMVHGMAEECATVIAAIAQHLGK